MCVTHVYQCPKCQHCMAISRVRSSVAEHLCEWIRTGQVTLGEDYRQPLVDLVCDNRFCMRRTDGGYHVCLAMDDPCYFCLRFGQPESCRNVYLPLICRRCHSQQQEQESSKQKYPSTPPHFRSQRKMDSADQQPDSQQATSSTMTHK